MDAQRYSVTITHELVPTDSSKKPEGPWERTVTMWGTSPEDAKTKVERWAKREFHVRGFTVVARATDAKLATK